MKNTITTEDIIELYTKYEKQGEYDRYDILGKVLVDLEFTNVSKDIIHIIAVSDLIKEYIEFA
jgi:hypothetical protein